MGLACDDEGDRVSHITRVLLPPALRSSPPSLSLPSPTQRFRAYHQSTATIPDHFTNLIQSHESNVTNLTQLIQILGPPHGTPESLGVRSPRALLALETPLLFELAEAFTTDASLASLLLFIQPPSPPAPDALRWATGWDPPIWLVWSLKGRRRMGAGQLDSMSHARIRDPRAKKPLGKKK